MNCKDKYDLLITQNLKMENNISNGPPLQGGVGNQPQVKAANQGPVFGADPVNKPIVFSQSNIRSFDISRPMEWPRWLKLLQFNFTAMQVTESVMKRAHFFTVCGEPLYNLACNVLHPDQVDNVEFDAIVVKLTAHF